MWQPSASISPIPAELKAKIIVCTTTPARAEVIALGHVLVAQNATCTELLAKLTKSYDFDLLAASVQMPSKAAGLWLNVVKEPLSSTDSLLSLVSATRDKLMAGVRPAMIESIGELRVMLAPGAHFRMDASPPRPDQVPALKDEESRLRDLIAKQPPLLKTIMEQGLGPPGACAFTFSMSAHAKKRRKK